MSQPKNSDPATTPAVADNPIIAKLRSELAELEAHEKGGTLTGEMHQRIAAVRQQLADVDQADTTENSAA